MIKSEDRFSTTRATVATSALPEYEEKRNLPIICLLTERNGA
jgi:hypothetical protein